MEYKAPVKEIGFVVEQVAGLAEVLALAAYAEVDRDTAFAVIEQSGRFTSEVIGPLNRAGDLHPATLADGVVTTTAGFRPAFRQYVEAGWQGVQHPVELGGQGLPKLVAAACLEMLNSASLSFALCPLLTDGAIEALMTAGSHEQQATYIAPMISGEWTGTMNLTESQAGSDLAQVRTKAVPQDDGSYRVFGQKIFISYGEHDLADNIVHLVLARTPDAPEGVRGISLFIVPKVLADGRRNDVWCASLEHKLGIKASPTAVLIYGDGKGEVGSGAVGHRIGDENHGLEYMFIMMNAARFAVGMQGVAMAERAYQQAVAFARDRVQSRDMDGSAGTVTITHHPDMRRMLMRMRALTEAARALAYWSAGRNDLALRGDSAARAIYEFMVPVVNGCSTESSIEVASLGVQVHGGMGFIEETGAAQLLRDARILTIYEGTTAIQANDLVGRKTVRDGGAVAKQILALVAATETDLGAAAAFASIRTHLAAGRLALADVVEHVVTHARSDIKGVYAGSVPYLELCGIVFGGWQMARSALAAQACIDAGDGDPFMTAKIATARFYAEHVLTRAEGLRTAIVEGGESVNALAESAF
ncbi:acyl-CoA dehydrogenase [soil metagenome]